MKGIKLWVIFILLIITVGCNNSSNQGNENPVVVGIAWRSDTSSEFYTNIYRALEAAGVKPVLLKQVKSTDCEYNGEDIVSSLIDENDILKQKYADAIKKYTHQHSNVIEVMKGIDGVVFTGGEDICPSLYATPQTWHSIANEKDFNATRDVNDYILMSYCLDKNIALMGICRGLQMLATVSGGEVIQDIPTYYALQGKGYNYEHRNEKATPSSYRDYSSHQVDVIDTNSIFYKIVDSLVLNGSPSWHHQAIKSLDGTKAKVVGKTTISGIDIIEALERPDKKFALGLQFHPEAAIVKFLDGTENKSHYMDYQTALNFFIALKTAAGNKAF